VGTLTSHNPIGLQGLLRGKLYFTLHVYKYILFNSLLKHKHPVALCRSDLLYGLSVYVQLRLSFTPLFIANIHCMLRSNRPSSSVLVLVGLTLGEGGEGVSQGNCYYRGFFFSLVLCCRHERVQFYAFVGRIFVLCQCVATKKVKVKVILRPTVSRPVHPGVRHPSGTRDKFFFLLEMFFRQLRVCYFLAPSLTRGRVCNLLLLLVLASAVPLWSESRGIQNHNLLSQFLRLS
jgi:hypothetical protein